MEMLKRKVTYRIYPSVKQAHRMDEVRRLHQRLYNCALEQRIDAFKRCRLSLSFKNQCIELTKLRHECPEFAALNAQSEQVTLKRLDLAFSHFFRRVKEGSAKAGFPRFKAFERYRGWGYKAHGDGWKLSKCEINPTLTLSGIGKLQARGRGRYIDLKRSSRSPGVPKTLEIIKKHGKWYASVTFEGKRPERVSGGEEVGVDWGASKFLTIVNRDHEVHIVENPRHLKRVEKALKQAQKSLSRKKRGSKNRAKAKEILLRRHEKLACKRQDFLHQESARLVASSKFIATEKLNIKNMTAHGGAYKKGLNRSILDTAAARFFSYLEYKAVDAGVPYVEIPTQKVKPSQSCSGCGHVEKKKLSERMHSCAHCGLVLDRDVNAATVILNYALTGRVTGWEPALCVEDEVTRPLKRETPSIPQQTACGL